MSETKQFDVPEVLAALEAAVAKRGADYVYTNERGEVAGLEIAYGELPRCSYVHHRNTGTPVPGCIVGQVFYDLTGEFIREEWEDASAYTFLEHDARFAGGRVTDVLGRAQSRQDNGATWGEALESARMEANRD